MWELEVWIDFESFSCGYLSFYLNYIMRLQLIYLGIGSFRFLMHISAALLLNELVNEFIEHVSYSHREEYEPCVIYEMKLREA